MVDVRVLSVAHDLADARLHRLCHAFVDSGAVVEVRALGDPSSAPPGTTCRPWDSTAVWRRGVRALTSPFARRCDILVVIDPDLIPGALLARTFRRAPVVVCDVHENYELVVADRIWGSGVVRRVAVATARLGRRAAQAADCTIVADEHLPPHVARRRRVVRNVPLRAFGEPDSRQRLSALYVGDVRGSRGAFTMVEGVLRTTSWELDIVGPVNSEADRRRLHEMIGNDDRIRLWGRLDPIRSWKVASGASVGLSLLADTAAFREAMPSKIYQYLAQGMAVVTSPLERPARLVRDHGVGVVAETAEEVAERLNYWSENPSELRACQRAALVWSERHLPDADEFQAVCDEILAST
jgi:glycosyltransferase involved in cell wall biosynthesis